MLKIECKISRMLNHDYPSSLVLFRFIRLERFCLVILIKLSNITAFEKRKWVSARLCSASRWCVITNLLFFSNLGCT